MHRISSAHPISGLLFDTFLFWVKNWGFDFCELKQNTLLSLVTSIRLNIRKVHAIFCRGITRIHRSPSRPSHPYGRQPHSLIFMSTLYKATCCLPARQLTSDHEPACMCHLYRLRIKTHVLTFTMPYFIARHGGSSD